MACAVQNCKSRSPVGGQQTVAQNISFHRFPTADIVLRQKWIDAVSTKIDWKPKKHHRLCSKHFDPACFFATTDKYRRLKDDSIPTLLLPASKCTSTTSSGLASDRAAFLALDPLALDPVATTSLPTTSLATASLPTTSLQSTLPTKPECLSSNCVECAVHRGQTEKLQKEVTRLQNVAKNRLLKINSLRQCVRRLGIKNKSLYLRLQGRSEGGAMALGGILKAPEARTSIMKIKNPISIYKSRPLLYEPSTTTRVQHGGTRSRVMFPGPRNGITSQSNSSKRKNNNGLIFLYDDEGK